MQTIGQTLRSAAQRFEARDALVMGPRRLTHAEVLHEAHLTARALAGIGVHPGDHVGILMPNCIEYLLLFYACGLIGARPVHFNFRYKSEDLRYVIAHSRVGVLFTSAKQREFTDTEALLRGLYPELDGWRGGAPLMMSGAPHLRAVYRLHTEGGHPWPTQREFMAEGILSYKTPLSEVSLVARF